MHKPLRIKRLVPVGALLLLAIGPKAEGQTTWADAFGKLRLETRFDAEATAGKGEQEASYGMHGRYFNLIAAGKLGDKFSYNFRQLLRAEGGSIHFFDNTDFLYVDYRPNESWRLRVGKDAMAVGGYEYDAAPIDEYLVSEYWKNIYCFQLAVSGAYTFGEGRQTVVAQVSQSPYINSRRDQGEAVGWDAGLLAYSVEWMGHIGEHVSTLWSTSMIERSRDGAHGTYMNLTMLGTQVAYGRWDAYVDLMHHALAADDWFRNGGWVVRMNYRLTPTWTLFAKHSREVNHSEVETTAAMWVDQMVPAGHSYTKTGLGFEYRPEGVQNLRVHGYAALMSDQDEAADTPDYGLCANVGLSWAMEFHKLFKKQ